MLVHVPDIVLIHRSIIGSAEHALVSGVGFHIVRGNVATK
jgi:hypothetical protein